MYKKKSSILSTIYIVALLLMMLSVVSIFPRSSAVDKTEQNQEKTKIALEYKGNFFFDNSMTLPISDDSALNIGIKQFGEAKPVSVNIYAIANGTQDFLFKVDEKTYSWNDDIVGSNMTGLFGVIVTQATEETDASVIFKGSLIGALEGIFAGQSVSFEKLPTRSLLRMEVTTGESKIWVRLYQNEYKATRLEISDFNIIF